MASARIPYRAPQLPPVDASQLPAGFGDPTQVTPYSPEMVQARENVLGSQERLQESTRLQEAAQAPPGGLEGILASPIFQLAAPTALSALAAIFPRTMGPAAGIGMAGFRSVTDLNQQNIQGKRTSVAETVKQRLADAEKAKLDYSIMSSSADPSIKTSLKHISDVDTKAGAQAFQSVSQDAIEDAQANEERNAFDPKTLGPGESASVGPNGVVRGYNPPEPTPAKTPASPNDFDEAMLAAERTRLGRELTAAEVQALVRSKAKAGDTTGGSTGMSPGILAAVSARGGRFSDEAIVKETQMIASQVEFVNGLPGDASGDQALIRAFAKVTDPPTGVREEEYKTIERYAQSWKDRFGFNVKRIMENTEFLTPVAREQIKNVIRQKYGAHLKQYQGIKKSYVDQINVLSQSNQGNLYLTDYDSTFPSPDTPAAAQPDPKGRPPLSSFVRP